MCSVGVARAIDGKCREGGENDIRDGNGRRQCWLPYRTIIKYLMIVRVTLDNIDDMGDTTVSFFGSSVAPINLEVVVLSDAID